MNKKIVKKTITLLMTAAMVISLLPAQLTAAGKPKLSKGKVSVYAGNTVRLNVRNGNKKARVKWKSGKKSVTGITKCNTRGNTAYARLKGISAGKCTVTATYKLGRKISKLKCVVTVKEKEKTALPTISVNQPARVPAVDTTNKPEATPGKPTTDPTNEPTVTPAIAPPNEPTTTPTSKPTATSTSKPTATPTNKPMNKPAVTPTNKPANKPTATPTGKPSTDYSTYKVNFKDTAVCDLTQYAAPETCAANADGSMTLTTKDDQGIGHDVVINLPDDIAAHNYTKVTISYKVASGNYSCKYYDKSGNEQWFYNGTFTGDQRYNFSTDRTEKVISFADSELPVSKMCIFDVNSPGSITINSVVFSEPKNAVVATAAPTAVTTQAPDGELYTKELFSVRINETKRESVDGNTCKVDMAYFNGTASGTYFNGRVQSESTTTIKAYKPGTCDKGGTTIYSARFILDGKDDKGNSCKIFFEDNSIGMKGDTIVTRPYIITNSSSLSWMERADIQGRVVQNSDGSRTVHFVWNESNKTPLPFRTVVRPDNTRNYNKELFVFKIDIGGSEEVKGTNGSASLIHFGGSSDCANFNGRMIADFADTRLRYSGQIQTLSARYILDGQDSTGKACRIFVDNIGIDDGGMVTEPMIITNNPDWAWIEKAPLHGTVSWGGGLHIHMWTAQ